MNHQPPHPLAGQTAVVTGAASGIGRAIALALAADGAQVLVHSRRNRAGLDEVLSEIRAAGVEAHAALCDLADATTHAALVENAWTWRGAVDIWVNNAGADVLTGEAAGWSFERKLEQLWRVDVAATMTLARDVGARMKSRGSGVVINMGWDRADTGMAGDSGELFAAIKGAVMAFTRSLARTLAPEVRVNCVAPGWIKTKWGDGASSYWQDRARDEALLARWGTPDDVAAAVRYLVSPAASFMTGEILRVNGGMK